MRTDVVTLFPAELAVGDTVFDPTSHRWHEVTGIGSGDGRILMATDDGFDLAFAAFERIYAHVSPQHEDVATEHLRPADDVDAVVETFWD
mgnify:CR=1 FL=1